MQLTAYLGHGGIIRRPINTSVNVNLLDSRYGCWTFPSRPTRSCNIDSQKTGADVSIWRQLQTSLLLESVSKVYVITRWWVT